MIVKTPSAFISYSWDGEEHKEWVRSLAARLRRDGVNTVLDQWEVEPGDRLPEFMEHSIRDNDFVLVVCTPSYKRKSDDRLGGVGYEGDIMTGEILNERNEKKFIPVVRGADGAEALPSWLQGKWHIDLSGFPDSKSEYDDLLATLFGRREKAPAVGVGPKRTARASRRKKAKGSTLEAYRAIHRDRYGPLSDEPFEDIRILRVIVEDVAQPRNDGRPGSALYRVPFALSATPPRKWRRLLEEAWNRPPQFTTMHRPGILSTAGATVVLNGTTIGEVKKYHRDTLVLAVREANRRYREQREQVAAARRREEAARQAHEQHVRATAEEIEFD